MISVEQLLFKVRPKFVKRIVAKPAQEPEAGSNGCAVGSVVAGGTPGIRYEIAARDSDEAGIGQHRLAFAILRHEGHLGGVSQPVAEWRSRVADVTRIFTPDGAQPRFHSVTHRVAGNAHAQAIAKSLPVRSIRLRAVDQCVPSRAE